MRVLVVDDEPDVVQSLKDLLEVLNYEVRTTSNGASAADLAGRFRPHVVILDINMPGINGLQTAWRMKRDRRLEHATFIAHTGKDGPLMRRVAARAGFDHFITKGGRESTARMLDVLAEIAEGSRPPPSMDA